MDVLLTFTGFHDPFFKGLIDHEEQPGPILSLLSSRSFNRVYLFDTPNTSHITQETRKVIQEIYPDTNINVIEIQLNDPTSYQEILRGIRNCIRKILGDLKDTNLYISVASGTPQMHACWILLASAGEIPARILHVRPPRFVTKERPLVSEIDLTSHDFPIVRFQTNQLASTKTDQVDIESARTQLGIIGDHPSIKRALEMTAMLAPSSAPILLYGETGTGKELFGRFIHILSGRHEEVFVPINCAAIPENLVESLLFGHKKGAFSGATTDQIGKFQVANKGSLFLDELGELPLSAQAKLLRVLQDGIVEPIGENKPRKVDVRIIGATNRDLRKLVKQGKFREDLFYRLNVGEITLPALRERRSDIPALSLQVLDSVNNTLRRPKRLSPQALLRLQSHNWPGNVRDLRNAIERSIRLSTKDVLDADDLIIGEPIANADPLDKLPEPHGGFSLEDFLGSARKQLILRALECSNGNQSKAARLLGISPQAVHKYLQKLSD